MLKRKSLYYPIEGIHKKHLYANKYRHVYINTDIYTTDMLSVTTGGALIQEAEELNRVAVTGLEHDFHRKVLQDGQGGRLVMHKPRSVRLSWHRREVRSIRLHSNVLQGDAASQANEVGVLRRKPRETHEEVRELPLPGGELLKASGEAMQI